jgi:hypothetical protein
MGDVNDPNYGQQTGPGWLNGGTGNGYGDGSYDDPYGGGSQGGGLDSYLQEIAQSGAGTNPYQRNGTDYSGWSTRTGYNMANLGRAPVKGEDFYGPGGGMITW